MIYGTVRRYTVVKMPWSESAREGLRDTFYGYEEKIREGVLSGKMELFRVNGDSWLVTERMHQMLFIWCYQGRGLVQLVDKFRLVARANGLTQISFFTHHRAALRALRRFRPAALPTLVEGETQYVIECADETREEIAA